MLADAIGIISAFKILAILSLTALIPMALLKEKYVKGKSTKRKLVDV
jgi:hypothetical protein